MKNYSQLRNNFIDAIKVSNLPALDRLIAHTLCSYVNNETGLCCPSLTTLMKATGVSRHRIVKAIKTLEAEGYLSIAKQKRFKQYHNSYSLKVVTPGNQGSHPGIPQVVTPGDPNLLQQPSIEPLDNIKDSEEVVDKKTEEQSTTIDYDRLNNPNDNYNPF